MRSIGMRNIVILSLVMLVATVLSILLPSVIWIGQKLRVEGACDDAVSIYNDTLYDYIVRNPSAQQITEMKADAEVIPAYTVEFPIQLKGETLHQNIIFVENRADISFTEYTSARLLESTSYVQDNFLFVDDYLAGRYGVSLNDTITVSLRSGTYDFVVSAIYRANPNFSHGACMALLTEELKERLFPEVSSAYVQAENKSLFKEKYLAQYKPMGLERTRDEFTTDEAYEEWLHDFENADPAKYYQEKNSGREEVFADVAAKREAVSHSTLYASLLCAALLLLGSVFSLLLNVRALKSRIIDAGAGPVRTVYTVAHIMMALLTVGGYLVAFSAIQGSLPFHVAFGAVIASQWPVLVAAVAAIAVGCVIDCLLIRGR